MIPVLYESNETSFTNNGIGRLSDCIVCEVSESRNGEFETEFQYPINGIHYDEITEGRIILVDHDEQKDAQPFIIYRRSAPINGVVTFNAHHVSYLLSSVIIEPFTASSVADAFNTFTVDNMNTNPFTFWTDNSTGGTMKSEVPASVRSLLGGTQGSILDVFGGEYQFDKFLVRNYAHRGSDKGVTIRYGKNLTNIVWEVDTMDLYGSVVPFWSDGESTVVYGGIVSGSGATNRVTTLDLSSEFDEAPSVADLESRAASFLASNEPWIPKENIKIDFVPLWQTEEYADVAPLERVCLCDTVTVYYTDLGVRATAKVIKVVWDALLEKYTTIELGQAKSSFADTIIGAVDNKLAEAIANVPTTSAMQTAINHATELITGGMGGNIVFLYDADGKPTDMLVMDTDDVNTAVHVLRINVNGIGFSSAGVSGSYTSAWTLDGAFVADWITAGHLSANRIQGGTLTLGGNNNGNGVIVVYDASGTEIGRWDNTGITASGAFTLTAKPSSSTTQTAELAQFSYYDYSLVSGQVVTKTGRGFKVETTNTANTLLSQYAIVEDSSTGGVDEVISSSYTAGGWNKRIYNGNKSGGGYFTRFGVDTYGLTAASYKAGTPSTTWDTFGVQIRNAAVEMKDSYMGINASNSGRILINGSERSTTTSTANFDGKSVIMVDTGFNIYTKTSGRRMVCSGTNTFDLYVTSNYYLRYYGGYWVIAGNYTSGSIAVQGSSSKRYKHDITDQIDDELDAHRLYDLEMKQFVYNDDFKNWQYGDLKGRTLPGFIAEDVAEVYPSAVIHDEDGNVESWDERRIVPGMLKLIQEQHEEIEDLKARIAKLETIVEALTL